MTQKQPATICWIFRQDVLQHKRRIFLRWPLPKENELLAEKLFDVGKDNGLGLALEVYCFDREHAFSYVLVPEDEAASEALMLTELKLKYTTDKRTVMKIRTRWLWQLVKGFVPKQTDFAWTDLIPMR